ncbi:MAG: hypothetical protein GF334_06445 [Candidatus Altiarchaeales archaeon]|nr:hypothetical protein [Candidatus Altiarchaeales archaeon]
MSKERLAMRLASRFLHKKMKKTAGEVRFIKDNSGDSSAWAFSQVGPSERELLKSFTYDEDQLKPLAECLLSTTAAMAHAMRAYEKFNNVRSSEVSPDGKLGGRGYIQNIKDIRKQFTNIVEALSSISDTIYDEIRAPHWAQLSRDSEEEREEGKPAPVEGMITKTEEIREDPEKWVAEDLVKMEEEEKERRRPKKRIKKKTRAQMEEEKKKKEEQERKEKEAEEKKKEKERKKRLEEEKKKKEEARKKKEKEEEEARKKKEEAARKRKKKKKKTSPSRQRDKELKRMNRTPHRRK